MTLGTKGNDRFLTTLTGTPCPVRRVGAPFYNQEIISPGFAWAITITGIDRLAPGADQTNRGTTFAARYGVPNRALHLFQITKWCRNAAPYHQDK